MARRSTRGRGDGAQLQARYELAKLPLPNKWALGLINGIWIDQEQPCLGVPQSRAVAGAYITPGAAQSPPAGKCCVPAPAILEFDARGTVLRAWGGPGPGYEWPSSGHGIYVDYQGQCLDRWQPDAQRRRRQRAGWHDSQVQSRRQTPVADRASRPVEGQSRHDAAR